MSNQCIMSNLDKAIHQSLSQEDQDFLARLDEEPPPWTQFTGIYKGKLGWTNRLGTIMLILTAIVLGYAIHRFFEVAPDDIEDIFIWGGLSALCVVGIVGGKLRAAMHMQTNRVLRELKKLELQMASLKQNQS